MSGRRNNHTEREASLIADAGMQIAMLAGNIVMAKQFGISASACKIGFDVLASHGLPVPALAVMWPDKLRENWVLVDQKYLRAPSMPQRHWEDVADIVIMFF